MAAMTAMCDNCPFGNSPAQRHIRNSLAKGRFEEICQDVWRGSIFFCHKTTTHIDQDDDEFYIPSGKELQCAGSSEFINRVSENRERANRRADVKR